MAQKSKIIASFKNLPILVKIFCGLVIVCLLFVGLVAAYFFTWQYTNDRNEKIIDKKFHEEVSKLPQIKVDNFMLWEGDSHAEVTIEGKGKASFWYGKDGKPSIESIGTYATSYECDFVDTNGKINGYAFNTSLILDSNSKFAKWFPFQVNNLSDLITHYDDIVNVVATFPKNPKLVPLEDSYGKRDVIASPNPNFMFTQPFRGKEAQCNLYSLTAASY